MKRIKISYALSIFLIMLLEILLEIFVLETEDLEERKKKKSSEIDQPFMEV